MNKYMIRYHTGKTERVEADLVQSMYVTVDFPCEVFFKDGAIIKQVKSSEVQNIVQLREKGND